MINTYTHSNVEVEMHENGLGSTHHPVINTYTHSNVEVEMHENGLGSTPPHLSSISHINAKLLAGTCAHHTKMRRYLCMHHDHAQTTSTHPWKAASCLATLLHVQPIIMFTSQALHKQQQKQTYEVNYSFWHAGCLSIPGLY